MIYKFRKYGLYTFILLLVFFLLTALIGKPSYSFITIAGICISGAFLLSLVVAVSEFYLAEIWLPNLRKYEMGKTPFRELIESGFREKDGRLTGIVDGYTFLISIERYGHKYLQIMVIFTDMPGFDKKKAKALQKTYDTRKWYQGQTLWVAPDRAFYELPIVYKMPQYSIVKQKIDELIAIVQKENLKPVS